MADKKLSSVSSVSDAAYVYAETSNGDTVKISKADLASVVAGLIGEASASKNGLMSAQYTSGMCFSDSGSAFNIDFNNYNGEVPAIVYGQNSPSGNSSRWHIFTQWRYPASAIQLAVDYETGTIHARSKTPSKGWSNWVSL